MRNFNIHKNHARSSATCTCVSENTALQTFIRLLEMVKNHSLLGTTATYHFTKFFGHLRKLSFPKLKLLFQ